MKSKIILCVVVILLLGACGRASNPMPPKGTTYPQKYVVNQG